MAHSTSFSPEFAADNTGHCVPDHEVIHEGAPPHFSITIRSHLDATYPGRWIGRDGRVVLPQRFPDLNCLNVCFWWPYKIACLSVACVNTGGSYNIGSRRFSRLSGLKFATRIQKTTYNH